MSEKIWKDIKGYEGLYQISSEGEVLNVNRQRIKKPRLDKDGYFLIDLSKNFRLFSAGRLDKDSEGMILFSNDGDFVKKISHPSFQVLKNYEVTTSKALTCDQIKKITSNTIIDDGEKLKAEAVEVISEKANLYRFTLNEGKKREIRRLVKHFHPNQVVKLKRVSIGKLQLGNLPCGAYTELSLEEISLALQK